MEKFSIVTYFWGNPKSLDLFVKNANKYTDDIVIVYINLLDKDPGEHKNTNIITVGPEFLINEGHGAVLQLATDNTKYDWVYFVHVGASIHSFDNEFFQKYHDDYAVMRCEEYGYQYTTYPGSSMPVTLAKDGKFYSTKFIFHNKNYAKWNGYVHEGVKTNENEDGSLVKPVSWYAPIVWIRNNDVTSAPDYQWDKQYHFDSDDEKIICEQYRKMTRTKWVALSKDQEFHGGQHIALAAYWEHKDAYDLTGQELRDYLLSNDMNRYNEGM